MLLHLLPQGASLPGQPNQVEGSLTYLDIPRPDMMPLPDLAGREAGTTLPARPPGVRAQHHPGAIPKSPGKGIGAKTRRSVLNHRFSSNGGQIGGLPTDGSRKLDGSGSGDGDSVRPPRWGSAARVASPFLDALVGSSV